MIEAAVYDPASGEIRRTVACPADIVALQAGPDEAVVLGAATDATHYVAAGALVAYTAEQRAAKAARPAWARRWSNASMQWEDGRTLEQYQDARWEEMKAARAAALVAPLVTNYGTFDADPVSQDNIIRTAQMMQTEAATLQPGETPEDDFTLYDNSVVTLTAGQMVEVALALGARTKAIFATGRALRVAVYAAASREAVDSVHWPA